MVHIFFTAGHHRDLLVSVVDNDTVMKVYVGRSIRLWQTLACLDRDHNQRLGVIPGIGIVREINAVRVIQYGVISNALRFALWFPSVPFQRFGLWNRLASEPCSWRYHNDNKFWLANDETPMAKTHHDCGNYDPWGVPGWVYRNFQNYVQRQKYSTRDFQGITVPVHTALEAWENNTPTSQPAIPPHLSPSLVAPDYVKHSLKSPWIQGHVVLMNEPAKYARIECLPYTDMVSVLADNDEVEVVLAFLNRMGRVYPRVKHLTFSRFISLTFMFALKPFFPAVVCARYQNLAREAGGLVHLERVGREVFRTAWHPQ